MSDKHQHEPAEGGNKPSDRAKLSILVIGVAFLSTIACMCITVFAFAAVL